MEISNDAGSKNRNTYSYYLINPDHIYEDEMTCSTLGYYKLSQSNLMSTFKIIPNPSTGKITVFSNSTNDTQNSISFYNTQMQLLFQKQLIEQITPIDLSNFTSGIYIAIIKNETLNNIQYEKVVINK